MIKKKADKHEELLRVLDKNGVWTGLMDTRFNVHNKGFFYSSVSLILYDKQTECVLLEQRSFLKEKNPGKWALAGGHVVEHEDPLNTVITEAYEEIGLNVSSMKIRYLCTLTPIGASQSFNHIFYVLLKKQIPLEQFKIQPEEVEAIRWYEYEKWKKNIMTGNKKFSGKSIRYKNLFKEFENRLKKS